MNDQVQNEVAVEAAPKKSFRDLINTINAASGPSVKEEDITLNGETYTFRFRKLSFIEADQLRAQLINSSGQLEPAKMVGNNARVLAKTLVDESNKPLATYQEICTWDKDLVDALAKASTLANKLTESSKDDLGKESAATADVASS